MNNKDGAELCRLIYLWNSEKRTDRQYSRLSFVRFKMNYAFFNLSTMISRLKIIPLILLLATLIFSSCNEDEPNVKQTSTSILLYAVASNNLSDNFYSDLIEMKRGLSNVDLSEIEYYVYYVSKGEETGPSLLQAYRKPGGGIDFKVIKDYDRETPSTDRRRISEVISDYSQLGDAATRGLILWSHSTAWAPNPGYVPPFKEVENDDVNDVENDDDASKSKSKNHSSGNAFSSGLKDSFIGGFGSIEPDEIQWWGQDTYNGTAHYCDLTDLAAAIPDNFFNFIWFDCCYMSSIEVIYELRNKADRFVAYPTEILAEGAPYDVVLPYIATPYPDLIKAADVMSDYFLIGRKTFTMAVIDPSCIEELAGMAQKAIPGTRLRNYKLQKYSRGGYFFYDFAQYTDTWGASLGEEWDSEAFHDLMNRLIIYKNCSDCLFDGKYVDKDNFSGISCCYFSYYPGEELEDDDEYYYLELEWYKRVFAPFWPEMNAPK